MVWIDGFPFDLAVTVEPSYNAEVAEHPVDADADISDHIRNLPIELQMECVVSDTPTGEIANHPTRIGVDGIEPLASEAAFQKLLEIREAKKPVTVETQRRTYTSMALTALVPREDASTTGGMQFSVSFKQIRILKNKRVTVRVAVPMVKPKAQLGTRQPKPSKLVSRAVDAHDGSWFDPDINAWRYGASQDRNNKWEFYKGTPVGDYPKGLSDAEYRRLIAEKRDGALVTVDKKGVPKGINPGSMILLPGQF